MKRPGCLPPQSLFDDHALDAVELSLRLPDGCAVARDERRSDTEAAAKRGVQRGFALEAAVDADMRPAKVWSMMAPCTPTDAW